MVLIGGESSVKNGMQLAITHYFATSLLSSDTDNIENWIKDRVGRLNIDANIRQNYV